MISIDENLCTLCGLCVEVCRRGALEEGGERVEVDPRLCNLCGHCKAVCPNNAPSLSGLDENEFEPPPSFNELPHPAALLRLLRRRRSHRIYKDKPVEIEKLKLIIEAGRFAPTGGNRQGVQYTVVTRKDVLERAVSLILRNLQEQGRLVEQALERHRRLNEPLPEEYHSMQHYPAIFVDRIVDMWKEGVDLILYHAPALILVHMRQGLTRSPQVDAGLAVMQMSLMAETLGLGACIIGFVTFALEHSGELRDLFEIPSGHEVHVALTVGYSATEFLRLVARNPAKIKWIVDR